MCNKCLTDILEIVELISDTFEGSSVVSITPTSSQVSDS